ncbi:MAG: NifU family protein [Deltaproteobacteria bacterium]|jgi:Fe-S cluster biogenesis protein NfuA|nr:NifU family protein [Deltaproteobacteria bacterium]MBW2540778.1 NifU family protein [Deltaproteobacteria bacterium]
MDLGFRMHAERTPNPNSIKWVVGKRIVEGTASANFDAPPGKDVSPLAEQLFSIDGVVGVYFAANFATVSKREEVDWDDLAQPIADALKRHLGSGEPALGPDYRPAAAETGGALVQRICRILDEEIRPAVARDGGDILFVGFREGVVELQMRGACSGCPSATETLKLAVESRLCEEIPEVREVVAV